MASAAQDARTAALACSFFFLAMKSPAAVADDVHLEAVLDELKGLKVGKDRGNGGHIRR